MCPEIYNQFRNQGADRSKASSVEDGFICRNCRAYVYAQPYLSGVKNRNHCPYCLWSRHVDWQQAGDRMSACKANMEPIGLTVKQSYRKHGDMNTGELMLIHRCRDCGRISINRIAADDLSSRLMEVFHASNWMDSITREVLEESGIWLLQGSDQELVSRQLIGSVTR
jgi:hypothetical protein